ncbi:MAG: archaemetzincin family Zn-dependent metalloprotease [Armatimonadota bacterium]|nr:archaemetzincin family Zn-dependent metalloprotease [Armatimonadota bacterium]MCX7776463.1 archaemetzincin family Zn-dependent metalloprotease [Armatimonadota bacterium]MDW8024261.1 archaemetzincin family Zn-dependent metalloprotease [Armatimonadota bacterium]
MLVCITRVVCCFHLFTLKPSHEGCDDSGEGRLLPIICIPIGVDEDLLAMALREVERSLPGTKCIIQRAESPIDLSTAFVRRRNQHLADTILKSLPAPEGDSRLIGVVDVDIYSGSLNFVFGIAELPGKRALVSTYRLQLGNVPHELLVERLTKEIVHELGHTFGLRHCSNKRCVMCFSNSIMDTDYKSARLCEICFEKYRHATSRPD